MVEASAPESPAGDGPWRLSWAEVDLAAVRHNVGLLAQRCAPASVCAVVKADGYGHGAAAVAAAALEAGASWLAVALVEEGVALRQAGIEAPVLVLSEPPTAAMAAVVGARLTPTVYTAAGVAAVAAAVPPGADPVPVHLKVDTGMHRLGAHPDAAPGLAAVVAAERRLRLGGLWTHLAAADDPGQDAYTDEQLRRFEGVRAALAAAGIEPELVHAANSAAALRRPGAQYDLVRCGLAVYGYAPGPVAGPPLRLRPALSLKSRVSFARVGQAGERISYGLRYELATDSVVATVPLGYADGVPRRLSAAGGEVLVGGCRRPIAGTVTMDQLMVDCGPDAVVAPGTEVVLLGRQGHEAVTAEEWAARLDTIPYEVLCGIAGRVPRVYVDG
ncbi:MAG TPA: alanine racemase [Dermatophilaceae bacterium]|nr:alanine racemase [Dermatophilaceae bacterium]